MIEELDESEGSMRINGVKTNLPPPASEPVRYRLAGTMEWKSFVDASGAFVDPTVLPDDKKGVGTGNTWPRAQKR